MKLICGLGNPGNKYLETRHNIGREIVQIWGQRCGIETWTSLGEARVGKRGEVVVAVANEATFMNDSGLWVKEVKEFYKMEVEQVIVVYDDLDLEIGRILVSEKGPKIHNGVNDVLDKLGDGWVHLRCGVDERNGEREVAGRDYVLGRFENMEARQKLIDEAILSLDAWVEGKQKVV